VVFGDGQIREENEYRLIDADAVTRSTSKYALIVA